MEGLGNQQVVETEFSELERLVIQYTDSLTLTANTPPDLDRMLQSSLPTREFVELAIVVATANATTRISNALKVDEEF